MTEVFENDTGVVLAFDTDLTLRAIPDDKKRAKLRIIKPRGSTVELDGIFQGNTISFIVSDKSVFDEPGVYKLFLKLYIDNSERDLGVYPLYVMPRVGDSERFLNDGLVLEGEVTLMKKVGDEVVWEETYKNLIVNVGKSQVASLIGGISSDAFTIVAIGSDGTTETATDTTLGSEIKRKQANISLDTKYVTNDTVKFYVEFSRDDGLTGSSDVREAGIFTGTNGIMLNRKTFSTKTFNWDGDERLIVIWKITVV